MPEKIYLSDVPETLLRISTEVEKFPTQEVRFKPFLELLKNEPNLEELATFLSQQMKQIKEELLNLLEAIPSQQCNGEALALCDSLAVLQRMMKVLTYAKIKSAELGPQG